MSDPEPPIPVVLFAYERPEHLTKTLVCMRENAVPLILAYSDGPKHSANQAGVAQVRAILQSIDWAEVCITERPHNYGLGRNVLSGVTEVAAAHELFIVWEDDLIAVPGTYAWMSAALRHYQSDPRVMSVSAWTHPRVTPTDINGQAYFDGRADCWVWGGYARSWRGMDQTASTKIEALAQRKIAANSYGADLPVMARQEQKKNIWAVRWLYHHLQYNGLCLRPPWSLTDHIGFDEQATHANAEQGWQNPPLRSAPTGKDWPIIKENSACQTLWVNTTSESANGEPLARIKRGFIKLIPSTLAVLIRQRFFRVRWTGDFTSWAAAENASSGYQTASITTRVVAAARLVRDGKIRYERDGVTFAGEPPGWFAQASFSALARKLDRCINILDFGGALGSHFFQHRDLKPAPGGWHWAVVEQAQFAAIGREEFQSPELRFFDSISSASALHSPDVVLLGSVLPYLREPFVILNQLLALKPRMVIIERTSFVIEAGARLTVQHVPRSIYAASYPCWYLDRAKFDAVFAAAYELILEQPDEVETPAGLEFRSFIFKRITT